MSDQLMLVDEKINQYCIEHSSHPSPLCNELEEYTRKNVYSPQMLIGKLEASLLGFLIKSSNTKRILEIGTYTGYSALSMAENLPADGEIVTIDVNDESLEVAHKYWEKSEHKNKITSKLGPALEVIPSLNGKFDLVFIDADKKNYLNYFKLVKDRLSPNGMIILDNCLWSGYVVQDDIPEKAKETTSAIQEINDYIMNSYEFHSCMLPVRDGMFLVQRK